MHSYSLNTSFTVLISPPRMVASRTSPMSNQCRRPLLSPWTHGRCFVTHGQWATAQIILHVNHSPTSASFRPIRSFWALCWCQWFYGLEFSNSIMAMVLNKPSPPKQQWVLGTKLYRETGHISIYNANMAFLLFLLRYGLPFCFHVCHRCTERIYRFIRDVFHLWERML